MSYWRFIGENGRDLFQASIRTELNDVIVALALKRGCQLLERLGEHNDCEFDSKEMIQLEVELEAVYEDLLELHGQGFDNTRLFVSRFLQTFQDYGRSIAKVSVANCSPDPSTTQ